MSGQWVLHSQRSRRRPLQYVIYNIYTRGQSTQKFIIYDKIVYCQGDMFRLFIGSSSGPPEIQSKKLPFFYLHCGIPHAYRVRYKLVNCLGFVYTVCNRRNGPDFGRVFLRSYYTDITQNTYIQSSMVTEILAREI